MAPEDVQGAPAASPPPDALAAPSAAPEGVSDQQPSGTAPPLSSQAEDQKPWNMPPEQRWEELRREREEWKRTAQELAGRLQQPMVQSPSVPQADPWEAYVNHPDPATAQFWQTQRRLMDFERQRARQETVQELSPVIDAGRQEIARLNTERFREKHPDIKPGSEEEQRIVAYMSGQMDGVRHPLESAKRNALYDKLEAENRALKSKQSLVQTKVAANFSDAGGGMPATTGLPQQPGDWRENVRKAFRKGGDLSDILNAAGAAKVTEER